MDDRFITLKHIDTSVAAKNVAKLLDENKTYFYSIYGDLIKEVD